MQTPKLPGESSFSEKGSKFLGFLFPIQECSKADSALDNLSKRYKDSTHICYAYRYHDQHNTSIIELKADAGEPSGTAGEPILRQLQRHDIVDGALFVVRYFGGTKLGKGGLARAYSECAAQTIQASELQPFIFLNELSCEIDPAHVSLIRHLIDKAGGEVVNQLSAKRVRLEIKIPTNQLTEFKDGARSMTSGEIRFSDE